MSNRNYPRMGNDKRKPETEKEGISNCGLPCIVCEKFTVGKKFVQTSWMRGDDELVPVCADHWKRSDNLIIEAFSKESS